MRRGLATLALLVCGCGDPLVPSSYQGEPAFSIEGVVVDFRVFPRRADQLTASLFWSHDDEVSLLPERLVEQKSVRVVVEFPASFRFNIFDSPPPRVQPSDSPFRLGLILVYEDSNNNGVFDVGELRGGAPQRGLLHTDRPLSAEESPTGRPLPAGFNLVTLPLPCEPVLIESGLDLNNCDVPLGAACAGPDSCGEFGICFEEDKVGLFSGGYCALLSDATACTPQGGVRFGFIQTAIASTGSPSQDEFVDVWLQACASDVECRDDYECVPWAGACFAKEPVYLDITGDFFMESLCAQF